MDIEIIPVTDQNLAKILSLQLHPYQQGYIETVEQCLKDAVTWPQFRPVGLYADEVLVGFAMYGFFPDEGKKDENGRMWLDRFLIDRRFQGQGLGSRMLDALIKHIVSVYQKGKLYLSLHEENQAAARLYEKHGFRFNGEYDENHEALMVRECRL